MSSLFFVTARFYYNGCPFSAFAGFRHIRGIGSHPSSRSADRGKIVHTISFPTRQLSLFQALTYWQGFLISDKYKIVIMKNKVRNIFGALLLLAIASLTTTGCVEHQYYHEHHHHSPDYYHRHHRTPPAGVDIDIHN